MVSTENTIKIMLADDDADDNMLFSDALLEIPLHTDLTIIRNGEQLLDQLYVAEKDLPDVIFLDLNMPRKSGFQCLTEIKNDEKLKDLPVVIISTANETGIVDQLYSAGAQYFIRKPNSYGDLKKSIQLALDFLTTGNFRTQQISQ